GARGVRDAARAGDQPRPRRDDPALHRHDPRRRPRPAPRLPAAARRRRHLVTAGALVVLLVAALAVSALAGPRLLRHAAPALTRPATAGGGATTETPRDRGGPRRAPGGGPGRVRAGRAPAAAARRPRPHPPAAGRGRAAGGRHPGVGVHRAGARAAAGLGGLG